MQKRPLLNVDFVDMNFVKVFEKQKLKKFMALSVIYSIDHVKDFSYNVLKDMCGDGQVFQFMSKLIEFTNVDLMEVRSLENDPRNQSREYHCFFF